MAVGSAAAFSGMAVCRVRGTPMIRGWRLSPVRIQVLGAYGIWIVLAWFPPLALCGIFICNGYRGCVTGRQVGEIAPTLLLC